MCCNMDATGPAVGPRTDGNHGALGVGAGEAGPYPGLVQHVQGNVHAM
jgi:hypothetical protein